MLTAAVGEVLLPSDRLAGAGTTAAACSQPSEPSARPLTDSGAGHVVSTHSRSCEPFTDNDSTNTSALGRTYRAQAARGSVMLIQPGEQRGRGGHGSNLPLKVVH